MYRKLFTILLVVSVALSPLCVQAQQDGSSAQTKTAEAQALRQKAFELLESLAGELGTLQSPENRARLGSNIAWSLWPHNENRARELFVMVQQDINTGLQVPEGSDPGDAKTLLVFLKLRADTIERIAKHDPELAYSFFKGTEKELPGHIRQEERALEAHLAKQLTRSNPDISLELARKMLAREFSDDLRSLLGRLNRKHKDQATTLYKEIVRKLGDVNLVEDWNPRHFALNLANSFAPPAADESTFRELVNLFIKPMVENGCTNKLSDEDERAQICYQFAPAIPLIAKVDPSSASKLKHWSQEGEYYSSGSAYNELSELAHDGSIDEVLALIAEYPDLEDDIRARAMHMAERDGDLDRARKIATEYTGNPDRKRHLLEYIDRKQARASFSNEELEEMQKRISQLPATKQVAVLTAMSLQIAGTDSKTATKLLEQVTGIIDTMKPGKDQTAAQMLLAVIHTDNKKDRGLAIMESLMPKLNDLVASAARLDGYDTRYLRDGEWNMTAEGELGSLLTWLAQRAGHFAWFDFDRSVSMAGQFERPEIRMMAQLKLAQGILAGPAKRLQLDHGF